MLLRGFFAVIFVLSLTGCQTLSSQEKAFNKKNSDFLSELWKLEPGFAVWAGLHEYDAQMKVPDQSYFKERADFYSKYLREYENMDRTGLSPSAITDLELLVNFLKSSLWRIETFKSYQWDPSDYNVGSSLSGVMEGADKKNEEKLTAVLLKLEKIPAYYEAAKANIHRPAKPQTELAVKQNRGLIDYISKDLVEQANSSKLSDEDKKLFALRAGKAAEAIKAYISWLEKVLAKPSLVGGFRDFRIGKELYAQKFAFDLEASFSPEEIYDRALLEKQQVLKKMGPLADQLWSKYLGDKKKPKTETEKIKAVIVEISKKHTTPDQFVETIRQQIPQLTAFVAEKDVLTLDPRKPLKVRETPKYMRGFAGASVDAPGPFEAKRETFYNVTPLDEMSPEEQESYLREYNDYTLQVLNIHEAIPGHYVQLVYSNQTPSLIKSLFGNGTMIEGWAVYSERMMLEQGYGDFSPELWLMYYKWFLRVVTNTIIDYEIHNKGLTRAHALHYMIDEAFQEKSEAEQKWTRANLSQVQLASYYTGFTEIYQFRESQKEKLGKGFSLKKFNEKFLSYGSASIKAIRSLIEQGH